MVPFVLMYGGRIDRGEYEGGESVGLLINMPSTYDELEMQVVNKLGWDQRLWKIRMKYKMPVLGTRTTVIPIDDDNSMHVMLYFAPRVFSFELFIEKEARMPRFVNDGEGTSRSARINRSRENSRGRRVEDNEEDDLSISLACNEPQLSLSWR